MKHLGLDFQERLILLSQPGSTEEIKKYSPSGRVPLLQRGALHVWDSLAICEYLIELAGRGLPKDPAARAIARSVSAEMHSGFSNLRNAWPMNARARDRRVPMTPILKAEVDRVEEIWSDCRRKFGGGGAWLFGEYSAADAMYAPVVLRFNTYGTGLSDETRGYMSTVLEDPPMREWLSAAEKETWKIEYSDVG